ncbi:Translation initiation factor 2 [Gammaproteobacteria bacterium]
MTDDPKQLFCQMVARLGRETQLHLDERHQHFRITDVVLKATSIFLFALAISNVYYIRILYNDLNGIVDNMESMHEHLQSVKDNMVAITNRVGDIDQHMQCMDTISTHMENIANALPTIATFMNLLGGETKDIEQSMGLLSKGMTNVDTRFTEITHGVAVMRENVWQISRPMGFMNPMLP